MNTLDRNDSVAESAASRQKDKHEIHQRMQREYYARTASQYDAVHAHGLDEHQFALTWLHAIIQSFEVRSVLDIGSGTGRALLRLKQNIPGLRIVGVEPSEHLREEGYRHGLSREELVDGDARNLDFPDGSFDLVTEFGALHHIPVPERAVAEMLRVARLGIFISDANRFGQGQPLLRYVKRVVYALGLGRQFECIRTGGKGYMYSEGDGLFYSYSVFDNYAQISKACASVHLMNTLPAGRDLVGTAPHVALFGLKQNSIQNS